MQPTKSRARTGTWVDNEDWTTIGNLWSTEPEYIDDNGSLLPLRLYGARPSLEALIEKARCKLTVEEVRTRLLNAGVVRKSGRRLVAATPLPVFLYPARSKEQRAHHLSVLNALAWTIERNSNVLGNHLPWFERRATAPEFPESELTAYNVQFTERVNAFLHREDAWMDRVTKSVRSARRLRAHVHVFLSAPKHQFSPVDAESRRLMSLPNRGPASDSALRTPQRISGAARRVRQGVRRPKS